MKYELHVGDYVETKDGRVGYIIHVASNDKPMEYYFMQIMRKENDYSFSFAGNEDLIPKEFNRIGQYDFTKKKQADRISQLTYFDEASMLWTVNQLVYAVNELRAAQKGVE